MHYSPLPSPLQYTGTRNDTTTLCTSQPPEGERYTPRSGPQKPHIERTCLAINGANGFVGAPPPASPMTPMSATMPDTSWRTAKHDSDRWTERLSRPATERQEIPHSGRSSVANIHRAQKRNRFFRTKPCKFFAEPTGCIKGDRCNFIHQTSGGLPSGLAVSSEVMSESDTESAVDLSVQSELYAGTMATSDASSCTKITQDKSKKNFHPVTWRVVGGGVTLGGQREVCKDFRAGHCPEGSDCKYAHPDPSEDVCAVYSYSEPTSFSPISPISSVLVPYPGMYPFVSPVPAFAPHTLPCPPSVAFLPAITPTPHCAKNSHTGSTAITSVIQAMAAPHPYSPHQVVDGSTLFGQELPLSHHWHSDHLRVAHAIVRPLSTPPTPVHGPDVGGAKVRLPL
ncbi:hypothetical protein BC628DRAFT_1319338 [Trametes gibbosa]|uniref:C3H1-type domain-containing protein n=1 Tax=Trametes gibbosa TaxID=160864 RepID=A0A6G6FQS3_9APHY|nr:hypothetical protein BC628DRAFT_1319338 [Trametes gibbosa]QIE48533.1 hypothetical protein [Trametes gibbosa]